MFENGSKTKNLEGNLMLFIMPSIHKESFFSQWAKSMKNSLEGYYFQSKATPYPPSWSREYSNYLSVLACIKWISNVKK